MHGPVRFKEGIAAIVVPVGLSSFVSALNEIAWKPLRAKHWVTGAIPRDASANARVAHEPECRISGGKVLRQVWVHGGLGAATAGRRQCKCERRRRRTFCRSRCGGGGGGLRPAKQLHVRGWCRTDTCRCSGG